METHFAWGDNPAYYIRSGKAVQLANYLAKREIMGLKNGNVSYQQDLELTAVAYENYIRAENDIMERFKIRFKTELKFASKTPYHSLYPQGWITKVENAELHEIIDIVEKELSYLRTIVTEYFDLHFEPEDVRYLEIILRVRHLELQEQTKTAAILKNLRVLASAMCWLGERESMMEQNQNAIGFPITSYASQSTKGPTLSLRQTALLYIYNKTPLSKASSNDIAKRQDLSSGERLLKLYKKLKSIDARINVKGRAVAPLINDIQAILHLLKGSALADAESELKTIKTKNV